MTSTILGIVALVALPEGVRTRRGEERSGEAWRVIRRDRTFLLVFVSSIIASFVYMQSGAALPLHIRAHGFSTAIYGLLISMNGATIILIELPLTSILRRFPAPRVIAAGVALAGVGFGMLAFGGSLPLLFASAMIWTFGEIFAAPMGSAYVADLAPRRLRGRYQGAYGLTFAIGLVLAPALGTRLYTWSPAGLWLICFALSLVGAVLLLPLPPRRVHPEEMASPVATDVAKDG